MKSDNIHLPSAYLTIFLHRLIFSARITDLSIGVALASHHCSDYVLSPSPVDRKGHGPKMPLLANIPSHFVQKGWWVNYTNPAYRQHIWTATNFEALIILAIMGIVGTFASNRAWLVIRHYLQPALQLPDSSNVFVSLSSIQAIKELYNSSLYFYAELRAIWKEQTTFRQKLKESIQLLREGNHRSLAVDHPTVPLRFGIWAAICFSGFIVLGIFIPFFLGEGLQGEAIVTGMRVYGDYEEITGPPIFITERTMLQRAHADWDRCFGSLERWKMNSYCQALYDDLPSFEKREMELTDSALNDDRYQFLTTFGDRNSSAIQMSHHTTLQDVGYNAKANGKTLYHELTCVPVPLGPFVYQINGTWQLGIPGLVLPEWRDFASPLQDSMMLDSSDSFQSCDAPDTIGSSRCGKAILGDRPGKQIPPATWLQEHIDDTLPAIKPRNPGSQWGQLELEQYRGERGAKVMMGMWGPRMETFLITFKLEEQYMSGKPIVAVSDDPIFAAHEQPGRGIVRDREVSALGCAEIFKLCHGTREKERICTNLIDYPVKGPYHAGHVYTNSMDSFLDVQYPSVQSVWLASHTDSIYTGVNHQRLWDFYNAEGDERARWQDDVRERFVLSMLRTRYASQIAAEDDLVLPEGLHASDNWIVESPLLYRNNDFTNINIWGSLAVFGAYVYIIATSYWLQLFLPVVFTLKSVSRGLDISWTAATRLIILFIRYAHMAGDALSRFPRDVGHRIRMIAAQHPSRSNHTADIPMSSPIGGTTATREDEPEDPLRTTRGHPVT
ncbi:hypothetical protein BDV96DRAFT_324253, partial [Lophiotrema nucula]